VRCTEKLELYSEAEVLCTHKRYYDFAVRVGFEVVGLLEVLAQNPMIVDFTVYSKC